MKLRVIAVTLALALVGGLFVSSAGAKKPSATDQFNLRTTAPCTFNGRPTTCTIDVTKLKRAGTDVMAFGTVTPQGARSVKFKVPVTGANSSTGPIGQSVLAQQVPTPGSCDILNLVLGPLHLDVLGLVIDLNQVILNITGQTGAGNLLGNLLCGLFGILDNLAGVTGFLQALQNLLAAINAILAL